MEKSGLECDNQARLVELAIQYLSLGKEQKGLKTENNDKFEMDFQKCIGLIKSSFKFDYKYDPYKLDYLHWYDFYNDLENLSTSEFGNCCIFNRVNSILHQNPADIKDTKARTELMELKEELRKRYCVSEEQEKTKEQEESAKAFYKALGIDI